MLSSEEINALGQAINTTWGSASTQRGNFPLGTAPQYSLKGSLVGMTQPEHDKDGLPTRDTRLVVAYTTIVTFRSDQELQAEQRKFDALARKLIGDWLKNIKSDFKDQCGRALKCKEVDASGSCEIIYTGSPQLSFYTQRHRPDFHRAYHRFNVIYDVR